MGFQQSLINPSLMKSALENSRTPFIAHKMTLMKRRSFLQFFPVFAGGVLLRPDFANFLTGDPFDVYLTFDDGPFPNPDLKTGPTDIVLQALKDHDAAATFFLHGRHILKWHGP